MSEKKSDIVDYKIPIWLKPTLSIAEAAIYSGISSGKLYQMTEQEDCPFVIWIGSRRIIKRKSFDEYLERQYSI
jgi:excisionase family DNA binding protein